MNQITEHIGCVDGSTIVLSHQDNNVVLIFGTTEARLSKEGATRLSKLLVSLEETVVPFDIHPPTIYPVRGRETIADLVEEGLLRVGSVLLMNYYGKEHLATVTAAGYIEIDGHMESTPSAAGKRVTGRECDGWRAWKTGDGNKLTNLRWMLRATRFPGDEHGYAITYYKEKRRIAVGWVNYALGEGLDPGVRNGARADNYLEAQQLKNNYSESTMNSYSSHLRQWFEWCRANNW